MYIHSRKFYRSFFFLKKSNHHYKTVFTDSPRVETLWKVSLVEGDPAPIGPDENPAGFPSPLRSSTCRIAAPKQHPHLEHVSLEVRKPRDFTLPSSYQRVPAPSIIFPAVMGSREQTTSQRNSSDRAGDAFAVVFGGENIPLYLNTSSNLIGG